MNNRVRSRVNSLIVVMTVIVFALSLIATAFFAFPDRVSALADPSSATQIGGGAELYDRDSGDFNGDVVSDLVEQLFGDANPVEYIKTNGTDDWEKYGKNSPSPLANEQYYVVPASTINSKIADEKKRDNGFIITLGGLEWMVASLTLADTEARNDNVIVTLYLADNIGKSSYNVDYSATEIGNNVYSRSTIRNDVLLDAGNTTWNLFSQGGADSFAENYLVQPKSIIYQQTESMLRYSDLHVDHRLNEALGDLTSGWSSNNSGVKPESVYGGHRYDEWGEDYIWIPSFSEVGGNNINSTTNLPTSYVTNSIWGLSNKQRIHTGETGIQSGLEYTGSWMRSGITLVGGRNNFLYNDGRTAANDTSSTLGVRPAIHLNLSAIGLGAILKDPKDVNTTYNGSSQTLSSIAATDAKAVSWYNKKWYEHANEYIKVTYPESDRANVGEYWAKVELQQKWFDDVRAEVDAEGAEKGWTNEQKDAEYELRKPKLQGEADVSDPEHMESDTVRWFKIKVTPKELTLTNPSYNTSTGVLTPAAFADESEIYADRPVIATRTANR